MLVVHYAPDAQDLVVALAGVLAAPLGDPLAREQVAVHSRGLERWVAQRLSHVLGAGPGADDGICAAVDFPFPARLIHRALAGTAQLAPDDDPWQVEPLAWHLLALVTREPRLARGTPLERHLADIGATDGDDIPGTAPRRFGAVRRVAHLFDRYAVHRPDMLRRWAQGQAAPPVLMDGTPLPPTHAWQATLWRAVRDHLVASSGVLSPPERTAAAVSQLIADSTSTDLPGRVALFGLTALPSSYLEVLTALATHRDVHLFLLHPSPGAWRRVQPALAGLATGPPPLRVDDPSAGLVVNPLLRTWGRDAREMQVALAATGIELPSDPVPAASGSADAPAPRTLLARLQRDVRDDVAPPGAPASGALDLRMDLDPDDRSIEVHGCHGPTRQAEVLRDRLLHRFAQDPTLEPRDVLVLCPDVDTFGPLLEAAFGATDPDMLGADQLRLRIADRSHRGANPLLRLLGDLLELVDDRASASQVRDLLGRAPVRDAFDLDDDDLERIGGWIEQLGVRWGLDLQDRDRYGVPTAAGTWQRTLDRLLVGAGVADDGLQTVGAVVPFDDVTSGDLELLGRFAEFVTRLERHLRHLRAPRPLHEWRDDLRTALTELAATDDDTRWQRIQVDRLLDDLAHEAGTLARLGAGDPVPIGLAELRSLLRDRLATAGASASHRTGDLTVASLVPMRSVPHRVVALLGMDDGAIPRPRRTDGDDLLELDAHVGDRDPRTEDRQLLLDALLAAREQLLVLTTSRDPRSNEPRPPALPIVELLDIVDRTARGPAASDGAPTTASQRCTTQHPLHGSDPRNFTPGALGLADRAFGTDPVELAGARAAAGHRVAPAPFLVEPLPRTEPDPVVELDVLIRRVVAPREVLLETRFGLRFDREQVANSDEIPLELRGLEQWAVGDRLLRAALDGVDATHALELERGRGTLPPGELGVPGADEVLGCVREVRAALDAHELSGPPGPPVQIDVRLDGGRRVVGAVDEVVGTTIRHVGYSRLKERDRLAAWVRVVALSVAQPGTAWRAVTVGRAPRSGSPKGAVVCLSVVGPIGTDATSRRAQALAELAWLLELHDRAVDEPLPLATVSSCRFATSVRAVADPSSKTRSRTAAATSAWDASDYGTSEGAEPAHVLLNGGSVPFTTVLAETPHDDEHAPPWDASEPTRFGRWALRLWAPLLDAELLEYHP